MSNLIRLIYVSRSTGLMTVEAQGNMLSRARERNETLGLTGALCTGRDYFVQALEGPEEIALPMYSRILEDKRHQQCSLLTIGLVASRAFPSWTMAHVEGDALGIGTHQRLVNAVVLGRDLVEPLEIMKRAVKSLRRTPAR
jgi:hypothetical protein